jgi:hypothetical protein
MGSDVNTGTGPHLFTAKQVAQELGIDESRVRRLAENRGVGRKLGMQWVFTVEEINNLRERPQGVTGQRLTAKYRRLDILDAITGALANRASTQGMDREAYQAAKGAVDKACHDENDAALMEMLRKFVPNSPRLKESRDE